MNERQATIPSLMSVLDNPESYSAVNPEWSMLAEKLGFDVAARLLSISIPDVRPYFVGERPVPDLVAARVHFLASIVEILAGAYDNTGIRRWFGRPRSYLGGATPAALLNKGWSPDSESARSVLQLAADSLQPQI